MRMRGIIDGRISAKCYAGKVTPAKPSRLMWGQPPSAVRPGEARRRLQCCLWLLATCALIFFCSTNALAAPGSDWTVDAKPAQPVNGAPVLFQITPPVKIESLTGSWLGHQFTFSYDASTKTW